MQLNCEAKDFASISFKSDMLAVLIRCGDILRIYKL